MLKIWKVSESKYCEWEMLALVDIKETRLMDKVAVEQL